MTRVGASGRQVQPRVLLVSNMYPSWRDERFGVFVRRFEEGLVSAGLHVDRVVNTDPRTGTGRLVVKYARLLLLTLAAAVRGRYDVVHAHYLFPTGCFALLASVARRKPLVLFSHGTDLLMAGRRWPISQLTSLAVSKADVVVAPSRAHGAALESTFVDAEKKVRVLASGIETALFHPSREGAQDDPGRRYDMLFVGALDDNKGLGCEDVIRAMTSPDLADLRLAVVGEGKRRHSLEDLARSLGLEGRIEFLPPQPSEELARLLRRVGVLAVTPRSRESLGLIALEAKASHIPVVATRVGGLPEHVEPGVTGELVEPGAVDELAAAVRLALDRSANGIYDFKSDRVRDVAQAGEELAELSRTLTQRGAA